MALLITAGAPPVEEV